MPPSRTGRKDFLRDRSARHQVARVEPVVQQRPVAAGGIAVRDIGAVEVEGNAEIGKRIIVAPSKELHIEKYEIIWQR